MADTEGPYTVRDWIWWKVLVSGNVALGTVQAGRSRFTADGEVLSASGDHNVDALIRWCLAALDKLEKDGDPGVLYEPLPSLHDVESKLWMHLQSHGLFIEGRAEPGNVEMTLHSYATNLNHFYVPRTVDGSWPTPQMALASGIRHKLLPWLKRRDDKPEDKP